MAMEATFLKALTNKWGTDNWVSTPNSKERAVMLATPYWNLAIKSDGEIEITSGAIMAPSS
jgi:hypothetical protein